MKKEESKISGKSDYNTLKAANEVARQNEELKQKLREAEKAIDNALAKLKWTRQKLVEAQERNRKLDLALTKAEEGLK